MQRKVGLKILQEKVGVFSHALRFPHFRANFMQIAKLVLLCLLGPFGSMAATFNFGLVSYDVLIPSDAQQLGVNVLNLQNFTGASALPPDFAITDGLTFSNLVITVTTADGSLAQNFGNFGPGALPANAFLQFPSNTNIDSVILSATLIQNQFNVAGFGLQTVQDNLLLYQLLPSAGGTLQPGIDFGVLTVDGAPSSIPEPATWILMGSAAMLMLVKDGFSHFAVTLCCDSAASDRQHN